MKTLIKVIVTSSFPMLALGLVSHSVGAQPLPPAPPGSSDNTQPNTVTSDVSTLNGQLVKVGDKNRYRLSHPKFNVAANPFGFIISWYSVSASMAVSNNLAIRGEVSLSTDEFSTSVGLGVSLPIYFRKVYSGLFFEPGISTHSTINSRGAETVYGGPQLVVGYHWFWDSNLNVAVAGGIGRNWSNNNGYNDIFPAAYFQVGYAFGQ